MDGLGADDLVCYCVCLDGLTVAPSGMPLLQITGVGTDADKNAVVEVDAVALCLCGGVVSRGGTRNLLAPTSSKDALSECRCLETTARNDARCCGICERHY